MVRQPRMNVLLLDIGSTSIKWTTFNQETGESTAPSSLPFPAPLARKPPYYEVDPEVIYHAVLGILENTAALDAVYFSVQMHGYLLADGKGNLLTPYISWQDQRSSLLKNGKSHWQQFSHTIPPESGSTAKANSPACSLFAMEHLQPDIFSQARTFYTLGSYLAFRLTGVNATHITDAAASGLYHAQNGTPAYTPYPALTSPMAFLQVGPVGAWQGVPVYSPVGDHQASVLGSGLDCGNEYLLNLGTAAQLCVVSETFLSGAFESRPYFGGQTLCTVSGLPGGREIAAATPSDELSQRLAADYSRALQKLPRRKALRAIGGVTRHHQPLLSEVCSQLDLPFTLWPDATALEGLIQLT